MEMLLANMRGPTGKRTRSIFKLELEFEYAIVIGWQSIITVFKFRIPRYEFLI